MKSRTLIGFTRTIGSQARLRRPAYCVSSGLALRSHSAWINPDVREVERTEPAVPKSEELKQGETSRPSMYTDNDAVSGSSSAESKFKESSVNKISDSSLNTSTTASFISSTEPSSTPYIILDPASSHILPKRRRGKPKVPRAAPESLEHNTRRLLLFQNDNLPETLVHESIDMMRPTNMVVSEKRYQQLSKDLTRSFSKAQLESYAFDRLGLSNKYKTKAYYIDRILSDYWKLVVSPEIEESSDVIVEKTIKLTKEEMFLIVAQNGRLPRLWTKTGARIVISGRDEKIIIRSTANTFDWILASVHRYLEKITTEKVEAAPFEKLCPSVEDLPLSEIQKYSETFVQLNKDQGHFKLSSRSIDTINHAKRLLVHSTNWMPRSTNSYFYDTNPENTVKGSYRRIMDEDAMYWNERGSPWYRWKALRTKKLTKEAASLFQPAPFSNLVTGPRHYECIAGETPASNTDDNVNSDENSNLANTRNGDLSPPPTYERSDLYAMANQMVDVYLAHLDNKAVPDSEPLTFSATLGHLLHNIDFGIGKLPTQRCKRTFATNVPFVVKKTGTLPIATEMDHDYTAPAETIDEPSEVIETDSWSKFLKRADANSGARIFRSQGPEEQFSHLVQLKFVPHPFQKGNLDITKFPPIEMWFEIDYNDKCDKNSVTLVSCEQESNMFLSLPDKEADIKYSLTRARVLDSNQEPFKNFVNQCQLDLSAQKPIGVPGSFVLNIDGEDVTYMYQTMMYRRQIDLKYKNHILQLSSVEGGIFSGRKTEATLVLDYPEGVSQLQRPKLREFVLDSLAFVQNL